MAHLLARDLQGLRRSATRLSITHLSRKPARSSSFMPNHEYQGERYRADKSMNFPSASTQNTVRRRVVDPHLPVIKKSNCFYFIHKDRYCKVHDDKIILMLMLINCFFNNIKAVNITALQILMCKSLQPNHYSNLFSNLILYYVKPPFL